MNPIALALFVLPLFRSALQAQKPAPADTQVQPAQGLAAERRELAEIRLLVAAERGYAPAKERLATLATKLGASADPEAKTLLAEVTRFQSEVRRALGEVVDASAGQDTLDEAVYSALRTNNLGFVQSLGQRAVPALKSWVRTAPDQFDSKVEADPLLTLLQIDPLGADELAGERPEAAGFYWKKRVERLYGIASDLPGLWFNQGTSRWLGQGFARSAEAWAEDPDVGATALGFLHTLARRGWRASSFDALVAGTLRSSDPARRRLAMGFDGRVVGAATYIGLLDEAEAELRIHAANRLASYFAEHPALLLRHADPEVEVRLSVADKLSRHVTGNAQELEALARLVGDPDSRVRELAQRALGKLPHEQRTTVIEPSQGFQSNPQELSSAVCRTPLAPEVYRDLIARGLTRELSGHFARLPAPLCFELLRMQAAYTDPAALEQLARELDVVRHWEDPRASVEVAGVLLANPALGEDGRLRVYSFLGRLDATRVGLEELVRWLLARPDDAVLAGMRNEFRAERLMLIDGALAVPLAARLYPLQRGVTQEFFGDPRRLPRTWTASQAQAARDLALDERAPLGPRVLALNGVAEQDFLALAGPIVTRPGWPAEMCAEWEDLLQLLNQDLGPARSALLATMLADGSLPEGLLVAAATRVQAGAEGADAVVHLVLQRGFDAPAWDDAVASALYAMGRGAASEDMDALARAARHPRHGRHALGAIGRLRDPRHLPLLSGIVAQPLDAAQLAAAVQALCNYLDAEAVEPLLAAAAKVQSAELRDQCLAQLEKIREYQDAKERWATRKVKGATRAQVIAELVTQLDAKSDEVRVQAIRALATWEAVEVMPKLIELSVSGSKSVAAAARDALERLNQPKGE